jgi:hypothetical protein
LLAGDQFGESSGSRLSFNFRHDRGLRQTIRSDLHARDGFLESADDFWHVGLVQNASRLLQNVAGIQQTPEPTQDCNIGLTKRLLKADESFWVATEGPIK